MMQRLNNNSIACRHKSIVGKKDLTPLVPMQAIEKEQGRKGTFPRGTSSYWEAVQGGSPSIRLRSVGSGRMTCRNVYITPQWLHIWEGKILSNPVVVEEAHSGLRKNAVVSRPPKADFGTKRCKNPWKQAALKRRHPLRIKSTTKLRNR